MDVFLNRGEVDGDKSRSASGGSRWNFLCPTTSSVSVSASCFPDGAGAYTNSDCISRYKDPCGTESNYQKALSRSSGERYHPSGQQSNVQDRGHERALRGLNRVDPIAQGILLVTIPSVSRTRMVYDLE